VKVLIVEDSRTVAAYLEGVLRTMPEIELLPVARDGATALELVLSALPDLVLLDLELPVIDGLEVLRQIMERSPRPVIVLSAHVGGPSDKAFACLTAGAVEVLAKPRGLSAFASSEFAAGFVQTVRLMSRARVVRRRIRRESMPLEAVPPPPLQPLPRFGCVLIGASTGGPSLLFEILQNIQKPYPLPILIAQHMLEAFDQGLASWLSTTGHRAQLPQAGERLLASRVYVAPSSENLVLRGDGLVRVPHDNRPGQALPSVDVLFESVASVIGPSTLAVLLTGMGTDGAAGMLALRRAGATTIAQAGPTCVVNGMPEAARNCGAVQQSLSPAQIIDLLQRVGETTLRAERLRGLGIS